jgi:hypothetical protein
MALQVTSYRYNSLLRDVSCGGCIGSSRSISTECHQNFCPLNGETRRRTVLSIMHYFCAFLVDKAQRNASLWRYSTTARSASLSWWLSLNRNNMQQNLLKDQSVHRNNVDGRSPFDLYLTLEPSPRVAMDYTNVVQCHYRMIPRPVRRMSR